VFIISTNGAIDSGHSSQSRSIFQAARPGKAAASTVCFGVMMSVLSMHKEIVAAIGNKSALKFTYDGEERIVEPQTYGLSTAGKEVLRAYQKSGGSRSGQSHIAKLFDGAKISNLQTTNETFAEALAAHNPDASDGRNFCHSCEANADMNRCIALMT
jgi:hypothetical protein